MSVCAFTSICQEDACWVPQYLGEAKRLNMPFVVHLDRCSKWEADEVNSAGWMISNLVRHRLCVGVTRQDEAREFRETDKQDAFDRITCMGYDWAMAWDIDETYELSAPAKLKNLLDRYDHLNCSWLNLWGDTHHVRIDGSFGEGHRVKFYNLQEGRRWRFDHPITNGAKLVGREAKLADFDLVCLHHGMMTKELRQMHKARWDRIYSAALKGDKNPYGFWDHALDESITPTVIRHGYFQ